MEEDSNNLKISEGSFSKYRHILIMVLCCVIPVVLIGILWVAGVSQNILSFGILLLCPIMHLLMMKNVKHGHDIENKTDNENKKEELT
ncbi:Uncharacterised protein [uncultured archaeon]|nr:Uncharacterised protein [uncultured archaeon]